MAEKIHKLVIADDHDIVRQGLVAMINKKKGMKVVAEAVDGLSAVNLTDLHRPDFLVVDNHMPGHSGIEVAHQLTVRGLDTAIIMLTMHGHKEYVRKAFQAGVKAYVLKDNVAVELFAAIETVDRGERYLSGALGDQMVIADLLAATGDQEEDDPLSELTERERTVFHGVVRGMKNIEIAKALSVSSRTVETHRENMMMKLGIPKKSKLVSFAIATGIVEIDQEGNILGEPPAALRP